MSEATRNLFTVPTAELSEALVRAFVTDAIATRLQAESLVVEFKERNSGKNVVLAVAAMANTDGGIVIVGIDEKAPNDPFVGIDRAGVDSIVQQLWALVPTAMPEVIPVALSDKPDRLLLVLRVDADEVDRPVVVDGRVMKRVPGQSVGARRDEILALALSETAGAVGRVGMIPWDPGQMPTWADDPSPFELRVSAQLLLPRHISSRRYLGTAAVDAALAALQAGPAPRLVCAEHLSSHELGDAYWSRGESTSLFARYACPGRQQNVRGVQLFEGLALVRLNGRLLETLLAIRPLPDGMDDATQAKFTFEDVADMLLAAAYSAVSAGNAIAVSIGGEHPLSLPELKAWMGPVGTEHLHLERRWEASVTHFPEYPFPRLRPSDSTVLALQRLVIEWLTPFALDFGAVRVEQDLAAMQLPTWARRLVSQE